nr:hypothetical protein [uncultured Albidiferax sp.]
MSTTALIQQIRAQRMQWIDIAPGKRVRIIRPTEVEVSQIFHQGGKATIGAEEARRFVVDWDGFTEADFLGAAVGASSPLPFDLELWAEVIGDHADWVGLIAHALLDAVVEHRNRRAATAKN